MMLDDEEKVPYQIGEVFVEMTQDEVQETMEAKKEKISEEVTQLEGKVDEIKGQMSDLKTHLYAKFGNAINLLKIESKMNQNPESLMHADGLHEDEYDDFDNDETENKPRSVITVAQPHKRHREDSVQRKDQEKIGKKKHFFLKKKSFILSANFKNNVEFSFVQIVK